MAEPINDFLSFLKTTSRSRSERPPRTVSLRCLKWSVWVPASMLPWSKSTMITMSVGYYKLYRNRIYWLSFSQFLRLHKINYKQKMHQAHKTGYEINCRLHRRRTSPPPTPWRSCAPSPRAANPSPAPAVGGLLQSPWGAWPPSLSPPPALASGWGVEPFFRNLWFWIFYYDFFFHEFMMYLIL